jgi:hypothetical protein
MRIYLIPEPLNGTQPTLSPKWYTVEGFILFMVDQSPKPEPGRLLLDISCGQGRLVALPSMGDYAR